MPGPREVLGSPSAMGGSRGDRAQVNNFLLLLLLGQVSPGTPAMLKTGSLGVPALKGRPDLLDTPGPPARPGPPASATLRSVPTSPASLPAREM